MSVLQTIRELWPPLFLVHGARGFTDAGVKAQKRNNFARALTFYRQAAALGDRDACFRIAICYAQGKGVSRSVPDAVEWYKIASDAGHNEAQFQLALIYLHGDK